MRTTVMAIALLLTVCASAQSPSPIVGEYLEARSGHVHTCGCLYSGEQVTGGREAILAWAFRGGDIGGTPLAGIKAAAVLAGDGHLGIEGMPRKSVIYVDSGNSTTQRDAAVRLLRRNYGRVLGTVVAVHEAPISFQGEGDSIQMSVGGDATVINRKALLPEDAHRGSFRWYEPFIPMTESTLATTLIYDYRGSDFDRRWWDGEPGITGYIGRFTIAP